MTPASPIATEPQRRPLPPATSNDIATLAETWHRDPAEALRLAEEWSKRK